MRMIPAAKPRKIAECGDDIAHDYQCPGTPIAAAVPGTSGLESLHAPLQCRRHDCRSSPSFGRSSQVTTYSSCRPQPLQYFGPSSSPSPEISPSMSSHTTSMSVIGFRGSWPHTGHSFLPSEPSRAFRRLSKLPTVSSPSAELALARGPLCGLPGRPFPLSCAPALWPEGGC